MRSLFREYRSNYEYASDEDGVAKWLESSKFEIIG